MAMPPPAHKLLLSRGRQNWLHAIALGTFASAYALASSQGKTFQSTRLSPPSSSSSSLSPTSLSGASSSSSAASSTSLVVSNGLQNLGNTCYMNAQLQCAFHIPLVRSIALSPEAETAVKEGSDDDDTNDENNKKAPNVSNDTPISPASLAMKELFQGMLEAAATSSSLTASSVYSPRRFCVQLGIPPMVQQDSQEFWKLLLPAVGLERLSDLYKGTYEDYITALDGSGRERRRPEVFLDLSLDVAESSTLLDSLEAEFGKPELLSVAEGNGWRPEKGADKVDAHKGLSLVAKGLPPILQFHLKRFQYNWQTDTTTKLNNQLIFPQNLDLSSLCSDVKDDENNFKEDLCQYDLQAVIIHVGEFNAGHYYAYVRPNMERDQWYRLNDDIVEKVSFEEVAMDGFGGRVNKNTIGATSQSPTSSSSSGDGRRNGVFQRVGRLLRRSSDWGRTSPYGWGGKTSNAYILQYVRRSDVSMLYQQQKD